MTPRRGGESWCPYCWPALLPLVPDPASQANPTAWTPAHRSLRDAGADHPLVPIGGSVTRAGYSVAEEAPIFLVVFAVPVAVALLAAWALSRP